MNPSTPIEIFALAPKQVAGEFQKKLASSARKFAPTEICSPELFARGAGHPVIDFGSSRILLWSGPLDRAELTATYVDLDLLTSGDADLDGDDVLDASQPHVKALGPYVILTLTREDGELTLTGVEDHFTPAHLTGIARAVAEKLTLLAGSNCATRDMVLSPTITEVLTESSNPVANRTLDLIESHFKAKRARARLELQCRLTELRLGRINGVDTTLYQELSDADLFSVMTAVSDAYQGMPLRGALHYAAKKGTPSSVFDQEIDAVFAARNWNVEVFDLFNRLDRYQSFTLERLAHISADPHRGILEVFEDRSTEDLAEYTRKVALTLEDPFSSAPLSTATLVEFLVNATTRSVEEVFNDPDATNAEMTGALEAYRRNGAANTDPIATTLYARLTKPYRVLLIRQPGAVQQWYSAILKAETLARNAARKAAREAAQQANSK